MFFPPACLSNPSMAENANGRDVVPSKLQSTPTLLRRDEMAEGGVLCPLGQRVGMHLGLERPRGLAWKTMQPAQSSGAGKCPWGWGEGSREVSGSRRAWAGPPESSTCDPCRSVEVESSSFSRGWMVLLPGCRLHQGQRGNGAAVHLVKIPGLVGKQCMRKSK